MVLSLYICGELLHQSQETNTQPKLMGASGLSRCMCIPSGLAELEVASSFLSSDLSTSSGLAFSERPSSTPQPLLMGPQHSLLHHPVLFHLEHLSLVNIIICAFFMCLLIIFSCVPHVEGLYEQETCLFCSSLKSVLEQHLGHSCLVAKLCPTL